MKRAMFQDELDDGSARCHLCRRECIIPPDELGYCRTRLNLHGTLFTLTYGVISSCRISPIEIKPVFHFYPGSRWLSLGSLGCNFRCKHCQNWEIAYVNPRDDNHQSQFMGAGQAVFLARQHNCLGISFTYNEPTTFFEYTLDCAKLAKQKGLFTNYVTNGYISAEALDAIGDYLDVFRVDLKGFSDRFYKDLANVSDFAGVLRSAGRARNRWNMHVEVVTNVIPDYNDDDRDARDIAHWVKSELGPDTPWHVTRFHPHSKLSHLPPTPVSVLERFHQIGQDEGLRFVYLGNVPGHPLENTYCPTCGKLVIKRDNHLVTELHFGEGKCKHCGAELPIIGEPALA
jgi:pyruvate formate lyase activating enzyme